MQFLLKSYDKLAINELYRILQLRSEIFVVEQNCVYNDLDGLDEHALHLMAIIDEEIIAYARILPPNTRFKEASIGRLVVSESHRFKGIARKTMNKAAEYLFVQTKVECINISAQKYLKAFYKSLGYTIISDEYLEDGIPHFKMELKNED